MAGGPKDNAYSVKYLGIVDGAMGILSRKMALQGAKKDPVGGAAEVIKAKQRVALSSEYPGGMFSRAQNLNK